MESTTFLSFGMSHFLSTNGYKRLNMLLDDQSPLAHMFFQSLDKPKSPFGWQEEVSFKWRSAFHLFQLKHDFLYWCWTVIVLCIFPYRFRNSDSAQRLRQSGPSAPQASDRPCRDGSWMQISGSPLVLRSGLVETADNGVDMHMCNILYSRFACAFVDYRMI